MTTFQFRPQTMDFTIFSMVYFHNEYRLPDQFSDDDIVIDIGAHIGSFTYAALIRGVGEVIAIEAHPQNYGLACSHLQDAIRTGQVDLRWGAVWRSDEHDESLTYSNFPIVSDHMANTGNVHVQIGQHAIPKYSLDDLIKEQQPHRIRLLKIDCEGAEFPIMLTSTLLHYVDEIVGEFHESGGEYDDQDPIIRLPSVSNFTIDILSDYLQSHGFDTTYERHQRYEAGKWIPQPLGYFRAKRE